MRKLSAETERSPVFIFSQFDVNSLLYLSVLSRSRNTVTDLSESEKEQLNEALGKYISGELTIDQDVLDALLKKNG